MASSKPVVLVATFVVIVAAVACGSDGADETLYVAGIPDQNAANLARRYDVLIDYLSATLGVNVEYLPTVDYGATVTAFEQDGVQLGWFGGLTGVMARREVPGSEAIAQRPRDEEFHSVFIAHESLGIGSIEELRAKGREIAFTFGSELSTSGHLMPRHFMMQQGIEPETEFSAVSYSGSHDKTWALVASGAFQAGALNEAVWAAAVDGGRVDTEKVTVFYTTPPYYDYNWTVRGDLDERFGDGFSDQVKAAILGIDGNRPDILELFSAQGFIPTTNDNYDAITSVAASQGIIE